MVAQPAPPAIVIKLGGSLTRQGAPRAFLARIAAGRGRVVVPGGGALADAVRAIQPQWELGDGAAHRMALLAMEQMAHAMHDLAPSLLPARAPAEILSAAEAGTALWFPAAMTLGAPDIAESWDVTSDSLAAWLALRIGARRLVLVKAAGVALPPPAPDRTETLARLAAAGIVDAAFATMARGFEGDMVIVRADDDDALAAALRNHPEPCDERPATPRQSGALRAGGDQRAP